MRVSHTNVRFSTFFYHCFSILLSLYLFSYVQYHFEKYIHMYVVLCVYIIISTDSKVFHPYGGEIGSKCQDFQNIPLNTLYGNNNFLCKRWLVKVSIFFAGFTFWKQINFLWIWMIWSCKLCIWNCRYSSKRFLN